MKIAFLDARNSPYTNARIKYLVSRGHQVYYFGLPGMGRQTDPEGVTCIDIGPSPLRKVKYLRLFGNVYTIRRLSQKYKLDVLHIIGLGNCIHVPFSGRTKVVIEHIGSDVLVGPDTKYPKITRGLYKVAYSMASAVVQDSVIAQEAGIRLGAPQSKDIVVHAESLGLKLGNWDRSLEKATADKQRAKMVQIINEIARISAERRFLHWDIDFPDVFFTARRALEYRAFDVTIGNPPYDVGIAYLRKGEALKAQNKPDRANDAFDRAERYLKKANAGLYLKKLSESR